MTWARRVLAVLALAVAALGLFWCAQGAGLVRVDPVLCAADCEPVTAPSLPWLVSGALLAAAGSGGAAWATRRGRAAG